jgi:hypothetical protein
MSNDTIPAVAGHGALRLPAVVVDAYNLEIKDTRASSAIAPARRVPRDDRADSEITPKDG